MSHSFALHVLVNKVYAIIASGYGYCVWNLGISQLFFFFFLAIISILNSGCLNAGLVSVEYFWVESVAKSVPAFASDKNVMTPNCQIMVKYQYNYLDFMI